MISACLTEFPKIVIANIVERAPQMLRLNRSMIPVLSKKSVELKPLSDALRKCENIYELPENGLIRLEYNYPDWIGLYPEK